MSIHENVKYSCNQCEYQATTNSGLKEHKMAIHENNAKTKNSLKIQICIRASSILVINGSLNFQKT